MEFLTGFHPPTQETTPACRNFHRERKPKTALQRGGTALAVEECVNGRYTISAINVSCFSGFRSQADDPPKPPPGKELVYLWVGAMAEAGSAGRLAQVGMVFEDHGLVRGAPCYRWQE